MYFFVYELDNCRIKGKKKFEIFLIAEYKKNRSSAVEFSSGYRPADLGGIGLWLEQKTNSSRSYQITFQRDMYLIKYQGGVIILYSIFFV